MDAAIRLMAERGFGEMSVIDVLAETGLSTRGFYRHFDSKEALLLALVRREAESVARAMARAIANAAGPAEAVEAWLERLLDTFFVPRQAARSALFTTPAALASPSMTEGLAEIRWVLSRPVAKALRAGHEAGVLVSPNPEADALSIFAVVGATARAPHAKLRNRGSVKAQVVRFAWPALGLIGDDPAGGPGVGGS
jgi:AcrR family transcriptional regulator